jgi:hypothetical protein
MIKINADEDNNITAENDSHQQGIKRNRSDSEAVFIATTAPTPAPSPAPSQAPSQAPSPKNILAQGVTPIPTAIDAIIDSIRRSPATLDLLPWENKSLHQLQNRTRGGEARAYPICEPTDGISVPCCLGSLGSRDGMIRFLTDKCFLQGPAPFYKVELAARRELEQTDALLLQDKKANDDPTYYRDCDVCHILELIHQHNLTVLITGDSVMLQTFSGLTCEMQRRGYHVLENTTYFTKYIDVKGVRGISTLDISGPAHWNNDTIRVTYLSQYKPKPDMLEISEMASKYDMVMMNFGLHWNWPDRPDYEISMSALFNSTKAGNISLLAFQEVSAQHFNTTAGAWVRGTSNTCVPLPTENSTLMSSDRFRWRQHVLHASARQAGYNVVVATDASLPRPKQKGGSDELVILPFYNFTVPLFDLHPNKCTHYCSTPFLWMPIWRSLRLAMDRQWSTIVEAATAKN